MLARFGIALFIFIGGLNLIWLGCEENGSANRHNPIWGLVDGVATLEKYALYAILGIGLIVGVLYVIAELTKSERPEKADWEIARDQRLEYNKEVEAQQARSEAICAEGRKILDEQLAEQRAKNKLLGIEENPTPIKVIPQKPKPTPDQLKQKAIQDILGR